MTTRIIGNEFYGFRLVNEQNRVVAFAATRSQLYLIAGQRGWVIR